jgi:hypothetical protein
MSASVVHPLSTVMLLPCVLCACTPAVHRVGTAHQKADMLCFVQFHHPGSEHEPDLPGERSWNTDAHRRKFLRLEGAYVASPGQEPVRGTVAAWGEWEPPSLVAKTLDKQAVDDPATLFLPVIDPFRKNDPPLQNTDPFIYGGTFLYGNCKQNRDEGGATEMQQLDLGSVILFGSNRGGDRFVLDTVFVVSGSVPYDANNFETALAGHVPPQYLDITIRPISYDASARSPGQTHSYRLYFGATPDRPVNGMFSFFPCMPWSDGDTHGFSRPGIRLPGIVLDTLSTWQRMNRQTDPERVRELWAEVVKQVTDQGLKLCVHADLPAPRSQARTP